MTMKHPNKLRELRERTPKSQPDLAKALHEAGIKGATKQKISKIESGSQRMTPQEVSIFARELGCDVNDILPSAEYYPPQVVRRQVGGVDKAIDLYEETINYSLDALLHLYRRTDPEILNMFDALRPAIKKQIESVKKK